MKIKGILEFSMNNTVGHFGKNQLIKASISKMKLCCYKIYILKDPVQEGVKIAL